MFQCICQSEKVSKIQMQEREIQYLEEHIPELAESAVTQAY